jgi:hypothetical protein
MLLKGPVTNAIITPHKKDVAIALRWRGGFHAREVLLVFSRNRSAGAEEIGVAIS